MYIEKNSKDPPDDLPCRRFNWSCWFLYLHPQQNQVEIKQESQLIYNKEDGIKKKGAACCSSQGTKARTRNEKTLEDSEEKSTNKKWFRERKRKNLDGICGWKLIFSSLYVIPLHSYGSIIKWVLRTCQVIFQYLHF